MSVGAHLYLINICGKEFKAMPHVWTVEPVELSTAGWSVSD